MKKYLGYALTMVFALLLITGCGSEETSGNGARLQSTFECTGKTDTSTQNIVLTYDTVDGEKIFYDEDTKIGTRIEAVEYAENKTGMNCKSGTDR